MFEGRRPVRVLLIDDDETFRRVFGGALAENGMVVETAEDGVAGLEIMNHRAFDVALVDLQMPRMDGLSLLAEMRRRHPSTTPIVLTGFGSVATAVEAMRRDAFDVLSKATPLDAVVAAVKKAVSERARLRAGTPLETALLDHEAFFGIVGKSAAIRKVIDMLGRYQGAEEPVLITGETGTGKELVARALHASGPRKEGPLIAVNCASLRENFVENELFGHVRGAFTGALAAKKGLYALADGGTLHIDEITEMSDSAQAALLRVLDSGRFRPLGASQEVDVNARVVASTNRDIERAVEDGRFRKDLFYRLNVCRVELPPLRERREDIPLLVAFFLDASVNARRSQARVTEDAFSVLMAHSWPGNIRELAHVIDRAVLLAPDGVVMPEHIGPMRREVASTPAAAPEAAPLGAWLTAPGPEAPSLAEMEHTYIQAILDRTAGNVTETSRILGIDPTTLRRKLRRWGGNGG
ncbi:MAG: sigma-54-dependent Fis family transcriptional regulator [Deltaproteobacteria bacterium]|nr:sigma-54-dependent Fis family transcriptional regulator [Deltaproteobacteria bacterium]